MGRNGVQPVQAAGGAYAGLVETRDPGLGRQIADQRIDRFQPSGAIGGKVGQCAFAECGAGKEVAHDLGEPVERQQLVLLEIDGHTLDAQAVLHGSRDLGRKRGAVKASAGTGFDFGLMLGDFQLRLGQIEDLTANDAIRRLVGQRATTTRAAADWVLHRAIRLLHHVQCLTRMAWLTAGGPSTGRAQTLRLGFAQPVGGRRFAAVVGVLGELLLERLDFRAQRLALGSQGGVFGSQRGDFSL